MANLAITNITLTSFNQRASAVQLGETCAMYDVVYKDANNKYSLADCTDPLKAVAEFILMGGGVLDNFVLAMPLNGSMVITSTPTLVTNTQYVLSATAGKIAPKSDLITGNLLTELFRASSTSGANFRVDATGIAMP